MNTDQINQLAQKQISSSPVGLPQVQTDESGRRYMPTMQALQFLQGQQQQQFDNGIKEAGLTGYYADPGLRNTLDQIQANKNINLTSTDPTAQANAQSQNQSLYNTLKGRYGIDGQALFNTEDNNQNLANLAQAYMGRPTMQKNLEDWQRQYQQAYLTGDYNGSPTLAKQEADAMTGYRNSQLGLDKQRLGLQQDEFNLNKDKYNYTQGQDAYTNRFMQMVSNMDNPADAYQALADYSKDPRNADRPVDTAKIFALIQNRFPQIKPGTQVQEKPMSKAQLYEIYTKDPNATQYTDFNDWLNKTGLGK